MTKTATSLSLSKMANDYLGTLDNKSAPVNEMLETLLRNRTSLNYIQSRTCGVPIDYKKLVELGVEALTNQIKRQEYTRECTQAFIKPDTSDRPRPLSFLINDAISSGVDTWLDLVKYVAEAGREINASSGNDINIARPYYKESKYLEARTNGEYSVGLRGQIYNYQTGV